MTDFAPLEQDRPGGTAVPGTEFIDAMPDGVLVVDHEGTIRAANSEILRMTGYQSAELVGASVEKLVAVSLQARHRLQREHFLQRPRSRPMGIGIAIECARRDGTTFAAEVSLKPLDAAGDALVVAAVRDVTDARATAVRAEQLQRLRAVSTAGKSFIGADMDIDDTLAVVTAALCQIGGFSEAEVLVRWPGGREAHSAHTTSGPVPKDFVSSAPCEAGKRPKVAAPRLRVDITHTSTASGWIEVRQDSEADPTDDLAVLEDLAVVVSVALDRATRDDERSRVERALRLRVRQQDQLAALNIQTLAAPTFNSLAHQAVAALIEILDLDHAAILELDAAKEEFCVRAEGPHHSGDGNRFPADPGNQAGHTLEVGASVLVLDLQRETRFPGASYLIAQGLHSGGSVIIPGRHGPWGVLCAHAQRTAALTQDDLGYLEAVAALLGAYAEHARIDEELRASDGLSLSVLETLTGPAALLDAHGRIVAANRSWEDDVLAAAPILCGNGSDSSDLLESLEIAASRGAAGAAEVLSGLRAVLTGDERLVRVELPAPGDSDQWHAVRIAPRLDPRGGAIVLLVDITDQKRFQRDLEHQALHDDLTGLPNRALLADRLTRALVRQPARTGTVGVFFLDIDRFKVLNDGLGHAMGDQLIVAVGERLTKLVSPSDTVARFGGDEFVIVCESIAHRQDAQELADRILRELNQAFDGGDGRSVTITASIGVALARSGSDAEALVRDADAAMYRAKERGRNRYEFFDDVLRLEMIERLATEDELRFAIPNHELRIYYQPIVDLASDAMIGVEALVRWDHPARGLLAPADFLAVAHDSGLIVPVGNWVLHEACRHARRLTDEVGGLYDVAIGTGRIFPSVSVNISPHQLTRPEFVDVVTTAVAAAGIHPKQLVIELTETVFFDSDALTGATLAALREFGVSIVIDDFGTGYASLNYLKRFPVAGLKIDQSFIDGVVDDPDDAAIVAAILGMAKGLGIQAVAEGIENAAQHARVIQMGCPYGQGYHFGIPEPAYESIARFITPEQTILQLPLAGGNRRLEPAGDMV